MENIRKENPRITRTRNAIQSAFRELFMQGRPEEINVKNITDLAGIHRKTFYLHYTCIEALYEHMIQMIIAEYRQEVEELPIPYDYYDLTRIMFEFYSADPFREKLITDSRYQDFVLKILTKNQLDNRKSYNPFSKYSEDEQLIINKFLSGASTDIYRQWIQSGKKMPMDDVIRLTGKLLENGVADFR